MKMTEDEYHQYVEEYAGYCTSCDKVTRDCDTEPDAEEYECPECEQLTCQGIENAMIAGNIEIADDSDGE